MKILLKLTVESKSKKKHMEENQKHDKEKRTRAFENDDSWKRQKKTEDKKDSCIAKNKRRMAPLS